MCLWCVCLLCVPVCACVCLCAPVCACVWVFLFLDMQILLGVVALLSLVDAVTLVGGKLTLKFVMSTCAKRPMARPTAANARIVSGAEDGSGVQPSSIEIVTVSPKVPSDAAPESESKTDVEVAGAGPGAGAGAGAGAGVGAGSEAGAGADADASSVPKVNLATLYRNPDHHLSQVSRRRLVDDSVAVVTTTVCVPCACCHH